MLQCARTIYVFAVVPELMVQLSPTTNIPFFQDPPAPPPPAVLRFVVGDDCISFVVVTGSESLGSLGSLQYLCSCGSALWGLRHTVFRQHGVCPGYPCPTPLSLLDTNLVRSLTLR